MKNSKLFLGAAIALALIGCSDQAQPTDSLTGAEEESQVVIDNESGDAEGESAAEQGSASEENGSDDKSGDEVGAGSKDSDQDVASSSSEEDGKNASAAESSDSAESGFSENAGDDNQDEKTNDDDQGEKTNDEDQGENAPATESSSSTVKGGDAGEQSSSSVYVATEEDRDHVTEKEDDVDESGITPVEPVSSSSVEGGSESGDSSTGGSEAGNSEGSDNGSDNGSSEGTDGDAGADKAKTGIYDVFSFDFRNNKYLCKDGEDYFAFRPEHFGAPGTNKAGYFDDMATTDNEGHKYIDFSEMCPDGIYVTAR